MDLSIVIVEYKDLGILAKVIRSIELANLEIDTETLVVSNSGYPESEQKSILADFKETEFLFNAKNVGFAKAVNQCIKEASGEFIMLLNPDAKLLDKKLISAIQFMKKNCSVGIIGPKIVDRHGSVQDSCRDFMVPKNWVSRNTRRFFGISSGSVLEKKDYNLTQRVDWVSGACMLVRQAAVEQVGLMDERYFMYIEDMDWCRQFWAQGWEVWYLPDWVVEHNAGRGSTSHFSIANRLMWVHLRSFCKYLLKWGFGKGDTEKIAD